MMANPTEGISVDPDENNLQHWNVTLLGPVSFLMPEELELTSQSGTGYEGGKFILGVNFTHDFPFKAPTVRSS